MKRRDLVKGLMAVPLAKLMSGQTKTVCGNSGDCTPAPKPLLMVFEGPFAFVLQKSSASSANVTGITVLVPKDAAHFFAFNGVPFKGAQHHFKFIGGGLAANTQVCVDTALKDFCVPSTNFQCDASNRFVEILNLPCPRRILTQNVIQVTFQSGDPGCMPLDHVLEYHISDPSQLTMLSYHELGDVSVHGVGNVFHFEVGRALGSSGAAGHAKDFHNTHILPCFPGLENDPHRLLKDVFVDQHCPGSKFTDPLIDRLRPTATTFECKSGGIIGGNP
jgi:hypothetical protein